MLTKRVTARQLRPLLVTRRELVPNAVEQLHVALLRVLLQSRDEGPRHGTSRLVGDGGIRSVEKGMRVSGRFPRGSQRAM